ncbi:DUF4173 domain-containing protein [Paenibacillus sp. P96]|uniref:DUF4173 domain-containing protein n=1 Tax=Paenibacillus zeirhizosphaerae TaxID=2987519 RepID=A0ABT9FNH5_9BACL|nr:DUF4173 domain-containing protein [Paenibacillus sp. P96]MDP4096293.1 DUF4173 domain-containing protein [Paenibacillus sp. P96]
MADKLLQSPKRPLYALAGAFLLAVIHQYLFYGHLPGLAYPLFTIFLYVFMFVFAKDRMREFTWFGWLMFTAVILLSLTYVLFYNPLFYALNLLVIPCLISLHMAYKFSARRLGWGDKRLLWDALDHLVPRSLRHAFGVFRMLKDSMIRHMGEGQKRVLVQVLTGLLVALPLVAVVMSLLSSADGIFDHMLASVPSWLDRHLSFGEGSTRLLWIAVLGLMFFGYLWGFVGFKPYAAELGKGETADDRLEQRLGEWADEAVSVKLAPVITATVLVTMNAVYLLFVYTQFAYLFGAGEGILPEGLSYAEYARSGFVQLVLVTGINFTLMLVVLLLGEQTPGKLHRWNQGMLYILVACSGVMLYSAYIRLVMYEETYGYTYTRFLVHAFMIFLGLLLLIAALRIHMTRIPLARCYIVLGLCAYVLINYIGMDTIIADRNIERYHVSGNMDIYYLQGLSADAVPRLIEFAQDTYPELNPYLRERITEMKSVKEPWQSFNLAEYRAQQALEDYFDGR